MFYNYSTLFCILILRIAAYTLAISYDYGTEAGRRNLSVKRQTTSFFPTTGVHTGKGAEEYGVRMEIRDLEKDPSTWTLYLLGLDILQSQDQADMLSWYQIAGILTLNPPHFILIGEGIHGRPYQQFNGIQATKGNDNSGYCTHTSILFPTWHRPYLAFYEQVLYDIIQQVASWYPEGVVRDRYTSAALRFRIPYWDWAAPPPPGQSVLPYSIGAYAAVEVDGPNGRQLIANPLFSYEFSPLVPQQLPNPPFNVFPRTLRYPLEPRNESSESHNNLVAANLDNSASSFRSRLYNLFRNDHNYSSFSNQAWISNANLKGFDSIESLHDQVHGLVGQGGHMSYIDYSAFDPIFWLHHTMLDRCFAMWQILNPDSYVTPHGSVLPSFTTSVGQEQNIQTALTPFYDANGVFWTSDGVRDTRTFGYTYPETIPDSNSRARVNSAINKLYSMNSIRRSGKVQRPRREDNQLGSHREWITNFIINKNALGVPFFIHIFLGPFEHSFSWSLEPNLVASHSVFYKTTSNTTMDCTDCSGNLVSGTIPLTAALSNKVLLKELKGLDPRYVEDYLRINLKVKISFMNDTEVKRELVPSLNFTIVSVLVSEPSTINELPVWGEITEHVNITCR